MDTHEMHAPSHRSPVPRPAASHDGAMLTAKVDALTAQVTYLVERQKKQEELFSEMSPILREVLATATTRLDELEKRGYFAFGREALRVGERVLESYTPDDVHAFADAVVSILDTVRTLTQPEVLATMTETGKVLENADRVRPLGIVGMVRATGDEDVQKGMAVILELLRHVGRASKTFVARRAGSPAEQRRQKLAEALGPRRKKALGIERIRPPVPPHAAPTAPPAPAAAVPVARGVVIDGVAFGADGHLADPKTWTPELGRRLAATEGVEVTEARWNVIELARRDFEQTGVSPNIRRLTQASSLTTKALYGLFPRAPARTIAKIAGIPKPAGCL